MTEPERGESDREQPEDTGDGAALIEAVGRRGVGALAADLKIVARVPSLRALIVGTAISAGATTGLGFWAAAFYQRRPGA